jgi:hypothetical protein
MLDPVFAAAFAAAKERIRGMECIDAPAQRRHLPERIPQSGGYCAPMNDINSTRSSQSAPKSAVKWASSVTRPTLNRWFDID